MASFEQRVGRKSIAILSAIAPLAVVFAAWEVLARTSEVIALFVPAPTATFAYFVKGLADGSLPWTALLTLKKAYFSYGLAAVTAIPFGLFIGWRHRLYKAFEPIIEALRPIPSLAMIAPAIIFFGLGEGTVQFVAFYALFWMMLIQSLYGIYGVDKLAMQSFQSMRASQSQIFRKLMVPSALPFIFSGLRQAVAVALIVTVGGEMIVGVRGLGYYLLESERSFNYELIYAALFVLSILGYTMNRVFLLVEHRILRWAKESGVVT